MKRSIQYWRNCDPRNVVQKLSTTGVLSVLRDAKADILELHAEVERLRAIMYGPLDIMVGNTRIGTGNIGGDAKADILELHAEVERLRGALETVQANYGADICCCGDDMKGHSEASDHAPVDAVEYYIKGVLKDRAE